MLDALTQHRLRNDDLHPLERYQLLARAGEFDPEPYRTLTANPIKGTVAALPVEGDVEIGKLKNGHFGWGCTGDAEQPIWSLAIQAGLGSAWRDSSTPLSLTFFPGSRWTAGAFQHWPDNTAWILARGVTYGVRSIAHDGSVTHGFVTEGAYDPNLADYLRDLYGVD